MVKQVHFLSVAFGLFNILYVSSFLFSLLLWVIPFSMSICPNIKLNGYKLRYILCMFLLFCFLTKTFILRFHQKIDPNLSTEQLACVSTLNGRLSFVFRHLKLNLSSFSPPIHLPLLPFLPLSPSVPWSSQGTCHVI